MDTNIDELLCHHCFEPEAADLIEQLQQRIAKLEEEKANSVPFDLYAEKTTSLAQHLADKGLRVAELELNAIGHQEQLAALDKLEAGYQERIGELLEALEMLVDDTHPILYQHRKAIARSAIAKAKGSKNG